MAPWPAVVEPCAATVPVGLQGCELAGEVVVAPVAAAPVVVAAPASLCGSAEPGCWFIGVAGVLVLLLGRVAPGAVVCAPVVVWVAAPVPWVAAGLPVEVMPGLVVLVPGAVVAAPGAVV
jgi:hypothetical protein